MAPVRPNQVMKILELTDSLSLHREAIFIPLQAEPDGGVTLLPDHRLRIVIPMNKPFEEWLLDLKKELSEMDLSSVKH